MSRINKLKLDRGGFTLIELVIVIVTLGIIAAVAIPKFSDMASSSKRNATLQEMTSLKKAIIGNPEALAGGEYIDRGFEGDIGYPPSSLNDLVNKPGSLLVYDPITRIGWNGPYVDSSGASYLKDAWDNNYVYSVASREIVSTGGGSDSIKISF